MIDVWVNVESPRSVRNYIANVRQNAAEALVKIGTPAEHLIDALKDKDNDVHLAEALAKIGTPAVELLIKALKNKDSRVQYKRHGL